MGSEVRLSRVYAEPSPQDGLRVLVDRIWPRGLSRQAAHVDEWFKDVAPSKELRVWYGYDPDKYTEFRRRYRAELAEPERGAALERLRELVRERPMTLVTATKDIEHSQAAVLAERLRRAR